MKIPWQLHLIAFVVVVACLAAETAYLFFGATAFISGKAPIPEVLVGRILGTLDMSLALVLGYYFTASIRNVVQRGTDPATPQPPKGTP